MPSPDTPIFVLDDDVSVRRGLTRLLRAAGYQVQAFSSGAELLAVLPAVEPACVISDVVMPGMDGLAFHTQLQAIAPGMPVLFITAYDSAALRRRITESGAACFRKPVDGDALLAEVERVSGGRR